MSNDEEGALLSCEAVVCVWVFVPWLLEHQGEYQSVILDCIVDTLRQPADDVEECT